ncbi:glycosyltransferase family 4 protein [Natronorubrum sp. DTA7]|uniref:glycosyltransferase family 4 protein n=1 Tax=Natronorubrum sp. DTA7 TaxID=3447016 RepID=UPI003F87912F
MDSLHLTTVHTPTDTRIFDKEATSLADAGYDIGILAHDAPADKRNGVQFFDLGLPSTRPERWKSIPEVAQKAKSLEASIYHFHDPELIPIGLYLSEVTNSTVIYDVHEDYGHKVAGREWIPNRVTPLLSYGVPLAEQFAASRFDAIVTATERIESMFVEANDNVSTIHNFPRTENFPSAGESKSRTAEHVLCYVGGLSELRGIHRMLEVLDRLCNRGLDIELWAVGSWNTDADKRRAKRFISDKGLKDRVDFPGYLDYDVMFRYLTGADLGLALLDVNQFETAIPTKQFDYLYSGLPVVATPLDAVIRFIPDKYRYIVPQDDTRAAADAVETVLESEYNTTEMQSLVEEKYSWESEAESLVALYEDLR